MNKLLLLPVGAICAGIAAMPMVVGNVLHKAITENTANLNQNAENFKILEYDKGYRTSKIRYQWDPAMTGDAGAEKVIFACDGTHGVVGFSADCAVEENATYTQWINTKAGGKDPFSMRIKGNVLGTVNTTLNMDPFNMLGDEGENFAFESGFINFKSNLAGTEFTTSGIMNGMQVDNAATLVRSRAKAKQPVTPLKHLIS